MEKILSSSVTTFLHVLAAIPNKETLETSVRRVVYSFFPNQDIELFFNRESLSGYLNKTARINRYMLYHVCKKNSTIAENIIEAYKSFIEDKEKPGPIQVNMFLNHISQVLSLMDADPYNHKDLKVKAIDRILYHNKKKNSQSSIESDPEFITNIISALSSHCDIEIIKGLLFEFSDLHNNAKNYLSMKKVVNNRGTLFENTLLYGVSGLTVVASLLQNNESILSAATQIVRAVHERVPEIGQLIYPHQADLVIPAAGIAVATSAGIAAFNKLSPLIKQVIEFKKYHLVNFIKPSKVTRDNFYSICVDKIFKDILEIRQLDLNNESNRKYIAYALFLNEKIRDFDYELTQDIIKKYQLSKKEQESISTLSAADIHEISKLNLNCLKYIFGTDATLDNKTKAALKNIDAVLSFINSDIHELNKTTIVEFNSNHHCEPFNQLSKHLSKQNNLILNLFLHLLEKDVEFQKSFNLDQEFDKRIYELLNNSKNSILDINLEFINLINESVSESKLKLQEQPSPIADVLSGLWKILTGQDKFVHNNKTTLNYIQSLMVEQDFTNITKVPQFKKNLLNKMSSTYDFTLDKLTEAVSSIYLTPEHTISRIKEIRLEHLFTKSALKTKSNNL